MTNLLRRTFILEPELNPHPLFQAPFAFFFLQPLLTLSILTVPLLVIARNAIVTSVEIAWVLVPIVLASPNTASYVFIVLLLPVALLLNDSGKRWAPVLIATYVLVCLPLRPASSWLFPKIWLLLILYLVAGRKYWRTISIRYATIVILIVVTISLWDAFRQQCSYNVEPGRQFEPVELRASSIYASSPALSRSGIVFESITREGYVLNRNLAFPGHSFHPAVPASGSPIYFELVADGHSRIVAFDPKTKFLERLTPDVADAHNPAVSPDGTKLAYISGDQLFIRGKGALLTYAHIEDVAWFPDGSHLAFSDGRMIYDSNGMRPLA